MVRHGITRPGNLEDERNLVIDLGEKVARGSSFYMWFYGQDMDVNEGINSVREWVDRAIRYVGLLPPRRAAEAMYKTQENHGEGGQKHDSMRHFAKSCPHQRVKVLAVMAP